MAKNRFFEAQKIHDIIREKLVSEQNALSAITLQCQEQQAHGVEIGKLILFEDKISAARKNVLAIEKNLQEKARLVEQAKTNLLKCSREYQVMERLKHDQNASWQHYLDKKEAAMLDEVAIMRHGKNPLNS